MSLYRVTVEVASLWDVALLPNHEASPAHVSLSLDADAICSLLYQAFEQELSVAYIERFCAASRAEVADRLREGARE